MPKAVPQPELDAIVQLVADFPTGASIDDVNNRLGGTVSRRTLQRRLALLVAQLRLVSSGRGRGCRYHLPHAVNETRPAYGKGLGREEALAILARLKPVLAERFGVIRLALFGSTARDQAEPDSDVDVIVSFDGPATSKRYFGVQFLLEDELGHAVDLVTEKAIRHELKHCIENEAVHV